MREESSAAVTSSRVPLALAPRVSYKSGVAGTHLLRPTFQPRADMERAQLECQLETLHRECWGWAMACCRRDPELAEDALQSAYLRVLSGRARFDDRSSLKTWVFGVIRVTAMEEQRRRRSWTMRKAGLEATIDVEDPTARADTNAELSEQSAMLIAALATVSPRQREVLQLVFYHGMTIDEAAEVMKVSIGSARTHYERGKKALAQTLAGSRPR